MIFLAVRSFHRCVPRPDTRSNSKHKLDKNKKPDRRATQMNSKHKRAKNRRPHRRETQTSSKHQVESRSDPHRLESKPTPKTRLRTTSARCTIAFRHEVLQTCREFRIIDIAVRRGSRRGSRGGGDGWTAHVAERKYLSIVLHFWTGCTESVAMLLPETTPVIRLQQFNLWVDEPKTIQLYNIYIYRLIYIYIYIHTFSTNISVLVVHICSTV